MPVITHITLDNNIHELVFAESSRQAINQFLDKLVEFYEQAGDEHLYIVLDMRQSGMLPLRSLTQSLRSLLQTYPDHDAATIALVLDDPQMLDVTEALLKTIMRRDTIQYFTQLDKARLWLSIEQNKSNKR